MREQAESQSVWDVSQKGKGLWTSETGLRFALAWALGWEAKHLTLEEANGSA